jgi:hypothetical protein
MMNKACAVLFTVLVILNIGMPVAAVLCRPASDEQIMPLITNSPPSLSLTSAPTPTPIPYTSGAMETGEQATTTNDSFRGNASISVTCNVVPRPSSP